MKQKTDVLVVGAGPGLMLAAELFRPDGHVGYRAAPIDSLPASRAPLPGAGVGAVNVSSATLR